MVDAEREWEWERERLSSADFSGGELEWDTIGGSDFLSDPFLPRVGVVGESSRFRMVSWEAPEAGAIKEG